MACDELFNFFLETEAYTLIVAEERRKLAASIIYMSYVDEKATHSISVTKSLRQQIQVSYTIQSIHTCKKR